VITTLNSVPSQVAELKRGFGTDTYSLRFVGLAPSQRTVVKTITEQWFKTGWQAVLTAGLNWFRG
jgi:hypothetical protein